MRVIPQLIKIKTIIDSRGALSFVEYPDLPFKVKRTFYMYDVPEGTIRGGHAHIKCHQLLIPVCGRIEVKTLTNSNKESSYILDDPSKGLIIPAGIWGEQIFLEKPSVLIVLASELYEENDYIRDLKDFNS